MAKEIIKKVKTYSENHVAMLLEDMYSQFKVFGEGQRGIERKVNLLIEDLKDFKDRFNKMDVRLSNIEDGVKADSIRITGIGFELKEIKRDIKGSYKSGGEYFSKIEEEIQLMQSEAKNLKSKLKSKADMEKILSFEKRLLKMEKLLLSRNS